MDAALADAVERFRHERRIPFEVEDRTIRLLDPVNGDPGSAVLRVLGTVQDASPVGAASHGAGRVAMGVWRAPELYLARWTQGKRWVVGYRLPAGARPSDYVRMEGRIPTRLEPDNWYGPVPATVDDAFIEAGLLLDDPPFPIPAAPPSPPPPPPAAARPAATTTPRAPRAPRAASPRAARAAPAPKPDPAPTTRLCPS
ncbi:MAG TPA: hypothetical protein VHF91_04675, partial [Acidimicrobiales bacterium]|nr:hypothetical protein [Acidimicrobiales bacterium]